MTHLEGINTDDNNGVGWGMGGPNRLAVVYF